MNKVLLGGVATALSVSAQAAELKLNETWDKTFPKSDCVEHAKAMFRNRFGITLAADVYKPKDKAGRFPAIAVSGPFGAVKEQTSGLYAQTLAEHGFLTIAFDPSFTGESGGTPRNTTSVDLCTEDFSAAVDYLVGRDDVDPDRIGICGICGWGGFAINAAAIDARIRVTVAVTMYDMNRVMANGYFDAADSASARNLLRQRFGEQRTADAKAGFAKPAGGVPEKLPENAPQFAKDYQAYYKTSRGFHPRSPNSTDGYGVISRLAIANSPILAYADEIERAVMVVHGEKAHSRYFGEAAFKKLKGDNKELVIVPGASHCDLYDGGGKNAIPFDRIEAFYRRNMEWSSSQKEPKQ